MKKIGFVDFYISEWHADNYPAWIKKASERLGTEYSAAYAWAEQDVSPVDGITTDEWCKKNGVVRCASIKELCEKSDAIIVLSPSNPEKHLRYASEVLPFGKRTYIDKTFAPDIRTAEEIFRIGEKYNTQFFSTSALRYAEELNSLIGSTDLIITGGGGNFAEYIIHTVEIAVKILENPVKKVKVENIGCQRICRAVTENNSEAVIIFSPGETFSVNAKKPDGNYVHLEISSDFFSALIYEVLRFFETGVLPFDPKQTVEAMRFRSALIAAGDSPEKWIQLNGEL